VVVVWPVTSYLRALTYPGQASFAVRTVEWIRDNGGGAVVDFVESLWFASPPTAATPEATSVPADLPAWTPPVDPSVMPPPIPIAAGLVPLTAEGQWVAGRLGPGGRPTICTTFERPDPRHPSIVVGVARIDTRTTRVQLVAGTTQPDRSAQPDQAQVPAGARPALVATFNSGFRIADARGGYLGNGHTVGMLRRGAASVVVYADGTATVGQWGRDVALGTNVVAVRQNLDLVVDGGRPVPGLMDGTGRRWGSPENRAQYTWRSGLGVDSQGDLVYVGGANLNLAALADALVQAGVTHGMQLDMHHAMVDFLSYPNGATDRSSTGVKLLPDMDGSTDRYLVPDQRDFFAVTLR
jgi:hypothetical protein